MIDLTDMDIVVADTPAKRKTGFGGCRDAEGKAMVFEAVAGDVFWMGGCLIPLDIVFVGEDGLCIGYATLKPPEGDEDPARVACPPETDLVVEFAGGFCRKNGLKVGDRVLPSMK